MSSDHDDSPPVITQEQLLQLVAAVRDVTIDPPLRNAQQAAEYLGVSVDTVGRLARSGALGYVRLSRPDAKDDESTSRRFRQAHLDEFISAREHFAQDDAVEAALSPRPKRAKPLTEAQQAHRSLQSRSRRTGQR